MTGMRQLRRAWPLGLWLGGCDADVYSERGEIRSHSAELRGSFVSGAAIAEGSTVCLDERVTPGDARGDLDPELDLAACYDRRLVGPAVEDADGCLTFASPGRVDVEFDRRPCAVEGELGDDRIRFEVVAASELRGAFAAAEPLDTRLVERFGVVAEGPWWHPGWRAEIGAPLFVIEDLFDGVDTVVLRRDGSETVATTDARATVTAIAGAPTIHDAAQVEARAGDVVHVELSLPVGTLDVGDVHVVARSEAVALRLAPFVLRMQDADDFLGLGAAAIAHDRDGHVLREPPVHWSVVDGEVTLDPWDRDEDGIADPQDAVSIADDGCDRVAAGTWRTAVLAGEMDALRETVEVRWQCVEGGDDGCGCTAGGGRSSVPWLAALLLARWRRRRTGPDAAR